MAVVLAVQRPDCLEEPADSSRVLHLPISRGPSSRYKRYYCVSTPSDILVCNSGNLYARCSGMSKASTDKYSWLDVDAFDGLQYLGRVTIRMPQNPQTQMDADEKMMSKLRGDRD